MHDLVIQHLAFLILLFLTDICNNLFLVDVKNCGYLHHLKSSHNLVDLLDNSMFCFSNLLCWFIFSSTVMFLISQEI